MRETFDSFTCFAFFVSAPLAVPYKKNFIKFSSFTTRFTQTHTKIQRKTRQLLMIEKEIVASQKFSLKIVPHIGRASNDFAIKC